MSRSPSWRVFYYLTIAAFFIAGGIFRISQGHTKMGIVTIVCAAWTLLLAIVTLRSKS